MHHTHEQTHAFRLTASERFARSVASLTARKLVWKREGQMWTRRLIKCGSVCGRLWAGAIVALAMGCGGGTASSGSQVSPNVIPVAPAPTGLAFNAANNKLYIAHNSLAGAWQQGDSQGLVSVVEVATRTANVIRFPSWGSLAGVAANPTTNEVFVVDIHGGVVTVINGRLDTVVRSIMIGRQLSVGSIAVNPATNRTYVASLGNRLTGESGAVHVIAGNSPTASTIRVEGDPVALAVNPRTNRLYVTIYQLSQEGTVSHLLGIYDASNHALLGSLPVQGANAVAVDSVRDRVYVGGDGGGYIGGVGQDTLEVVDGATQQIVASIATSPGISGIAVNEPTGRVYLAHQSGQVLSLVDSASQRVIATRSVGRSLGGIAVDLSTGRVFVSNFDDNTLTISEGL